jgi:hypothetical protein
MSRAFDTIDRAKLVQILKEEVQLEEDEMRMCQSLLANTNLKVKLGEALSDPFETTIGSPQGDGLSPIIFAVYLESALRQVRAKASEMHPRPADDSELPHEALYADDSDFISTSPSFLKFLKALIPPTIGQFKLQANATKWEDTTLTASAKDDDRPSWRTTKKLGSLLGDEEDIERRKSLATASFKALRLLWERRKITSVNTRIRAYNALVLPVLLYNCGTWGVTGGVIEKLEVFHRRQLREVLGVKTKDLHNVDLYERCGVSPVKHHVAWAKWSLFGHTLRMTRDTPAQVAMDFYCQSSESDVKSMGRASTTLPAQLFNEYRDYLKKFKLGGHTSKMHMILAKLRKMADGKADPSRQKWRELSASIIKCQIPSFVYRTVLG